MTNVSVVEASMVVKNPVLIRQLRRLTLSENSNLKFELRRLKEVSQTKHIKAKVILSKNIDGKIIAWALLNREAFIYNPGTGYTFQLYVSEKARRKKIGESLLRRAVSIARQENEKIFVIPWNLESIKFFDKYYDDTVVNYWEAGGKFNYQEIDR